MDLYRNKYLICVYAPVSEGETLIALCNNASEFAEFVGIKGNVARQILFNLFSKKTRFIRLWGKLCTVEFVEEGEDE